MARYLTIADQFFDANGDPLSGGKLYTYDTGTTNAKTTYSDSALSTANANPIILDAAGVPGDIFFTGTAKFVLKDADDVQIRVMDPIEACCAVAVEQIVAGTNITISPTTGVGVVTINSSGGGDPYWTFDTTVKTADFTAVAGYFYFIDVDTAGADVTVTLPASPSVGDRVGVRNVDFDYNNPLIVDGGTNTVNSKLNGGATTFNLSEYGSPAADIQGAEIIYLSTGWVFYSTTYLKAPV